MEVRRHRRLIAKLLRCFGVWHVECVEHGERVCRALLEKACGACQADMCCARCSSSEDESTTNASQVFLLRGHAACRPPWLIDLVKRTSVSLVEVFQRTAHYRGLVAGVCVFSSVWRVELV